jgi:hypothetical protein
MVARELCRAGAGGLRLVRHVTLRLSPIDLAAEPALAKLIAAVDLDELTADR